MSVTILKVSVSVFLPGSAVVRLEVLVIFTGLAPQMCFKVRSAAIFSTGGKGIDGTYDRAIAHFCSPRPLVTTGRTQSI